MNLSDVKVRVTLNNRLDQEQYYVETSGYGRCDIAQAVAFEDKPMGQVLGRCDIDWKGNIDFQGSCSPELRQLLERELLDQVTLGYFRAHTKFFEELKKKYDFRHL